MQARDFCLLRKKAGRALVKSKKTEVAEVSTDDHLRPHEPEEHVLTTTFRQKIIEKKIIMLRRDLKPWVW
jgi:hypothetical protein